MLPASPATLRVQTQRSKRLITRENVQGRRFEFCPRYLHFDLLDEDHTQDHTEFIVDIFTHPSGNTKEKFAQEHDR